MEKQQKPDASYFRWRKTSRQNLLYVEVWKNHYTNMAYFNFEGYDKLQNIFAKMIQVII